MSMHRLSNQTFASYLYQAKCTDSRQRRKILEGLAVKIKSNTA